MIIKGIINVNRGQGEPDDSTLPTISRFEVQINPDNLNAFNIVFAALRFSELTLIKTIVDTGEIILIILSTEDNYPDSRHESSKVTFQLKATNKNGDTFSNIVTIDSKISKINTTLSTLTASTTITRVINTTNEVDIIIKIDKTAEFDPEKIENTTLRYRKQGSLTWEILNISTKYISAYHQIGGDIMGYSYGLQKGVIERGVVGGLFDFCVLIRVKGFEGYHSEIQTIFFENIRVEDLAKEGSKTFPKTEILDAEHPSFLRYEIKTKFLEKFEVRSRLKKQAKNEDKLYGDGGEEFYPNEKSHFFLDPELVVGLQIERDFYYNKSHSSEETQGYMYPACISEILPCIRTQRLDSSDTSRNRLIILFWKINDNFFDYSYFNNQINIKTNSLIVKVQYKNSSGVYQDLTDQITLTQEEHFNAKDQKFVLQVNHKDVVNLDLFYKVNERDNYSDNLRILIVTHKVLCSSVVKSIALYENVQLSFGKLLMPHEWNYICYDKFLGRNSEARIGEDNLSLSLRSPYLRGIRLLEKGFACFDKLTDINIQYDKHSDIKQENFDVNIFYKLKASVEAFYFDPIYKGTINSVNLPTIPNDVFLIPPELEIDPPNLVKSGVGSEQARGVVRLNEYGKISSIELSVLGQGYSQYKTLQDQREQSEFDIIPTVSMDYTVVGNNLNINRQNLIVQNLSFDKSNLKASLNHGVRLAHVLEDVKNSSSISKEQQIKIDKYLEQTSPKDVEMGGNSSSTYSVESSYSNPQTFKSLDPTWDIISRLYPERDSNSQEKLIIYNQDANPEASELEDSKNSPSVASSHDSLFTTSSTDNGQPLVSEGGSSYSTFAANGATVTPAGNPAVSIVNKKSLPWLPLIPKAGDGNGAMSHGPLPNMIPRASTFNKLAAGVNLLNKVRVIVPRVNRIESTTIDNIYYNPDDGLSKYIEPLGELVNTNFSNENYLAAAESSFNFYATLTAERIFKREYDDPQQFPQGIYVKTLESSTEYRVSQVAHPLFEELIQNLFSGQSVGLSKIATLEETKVSFLKEYKVLNEDGKYVVNCGGEADANNERGRKRTISESTLPTTAWDQTFAYQTGPFIGELKVEELPVIYSLHEPSLKTTSSFCEFGYYPSKTKLYSPKLVNFYPFIVDV